MTLLRLTAIVALLWLPGGCSSKPKGQAANEIIVLQEVNDLLHSVEGASGRPAAEMVDLDKFQSMYPRAHESVKSGDVVVIWGAALRGEGEIGKGEVVVAYEKNVPTAGGHVLFSAGTVKKMTASEFESAPKAR